MEICEFFDIRDRWKRSEIDWLLYSHVQFAVNSVRKISHSLRFRFHGIFVVHLPVAAVSAVLPLIYHKMCWNEIHITHNQSNDRQHMLICTQKIVHDYCNWIGAKKQNVWCSELGRSPRWPHIFSLSRRNCCSIEHISVSAKPCGDLPCT